MASPPGDTPVISAEKLAIVQETAPTLKAHAQEITMAFYHNMKDKYAHLRNAFGKAPRDLATAILAYATWLDDPARLMRAVERIAQKHVAADITPDLYVIVGEGLLVAIAQVLPNWTTPAILDAWRDAYAVLSHILITRESQIYNEVADDRKAEGRVEATADEAEVQASV